MGAPYPLTKENRKPITNLGRTAPGEDGLDLPMTQVGTAISAKDLETNDPAATSELKKRVIGIHIGELYASGRPAVIETVLGSCVAVCLHDPVNRVGGMNHIFLPGRADFKNFNNIARYGINAMELLINRIMVLGGSRRDLVAKAFGGARILSSIAVENGMGVKNAEFVLEFLEMEGIPVVNQDLGGQDTRRIYFHTDTGNVFLKRIVRSTHSNILGQERSLLKRVRREAEEGGEITLFD